MKRGKMLEWILRNRPTIGSARPDIVGESADRWSREVLAERARLLGVSVEEAANVGSYKAEFLESIERLAKLGEFPSPEAYLEAYGRRIGRSRYPTPECLSSNDIVEYSEGRQFSAEQQEHLASCVQCSNLVNATLPSEEGLARIRQELRNLVGGIRPEPKLPVDERIPDATYIPVPAMRQAEAVGWRFGFAQIMAMASAVLVVLAAGMGYWRYVGKQQVDPEKDRALAGGLTAVLTSNLGTIETLRVTAPESTVRYEDKNKSAADIAKELNVEAIVETSQRRIGGRWVVSTAFWPTDLAHATSIAVLPRGAVSDPRLKQATFERDGRDLSDLRQQVVRALVTEAKLRVSKDDLERLEVSRRVNPEAYGLYLQGRYYLSKRTREDLDRSVGYFQEAISHDPKSAIAYAGLADAYSLMALHGFLPPQKAFPEAHSNADIALGFDEKLPEAQAARGLSMVSEWRWGEAEEAFRRALELNPSYAEAYHWHGLQLSFQGRHDQAMSSLRRAKELDPLSPTVTSALGDVLFFSRQYTDAIQQYQSALQMTPKPEYASFDLGLAELFAGQTKQALDRFEGDDLGLAYAYAFSGKPTEARKHLQAVLSSKNGPSSYEIAQVYAALGEKDTALDWLGKAFGAHDFELLEIKVDPALEPLHSDQRFEKLLHRMGLSNATLTVAE